MLCLNYVDDMFGDVWNTFRTCLDCLWPMLGLFMEYVWTMFGICPDHVWTMLGVFLEYVRERNRTKMAYARVMLRICVKYIGSMFATLVRASLEQVWALLSLSLAYASDMCLAFVVIML